MAKKRKVSAYNRHVGREMKAGKTMKQAAASWRSRGKSKSTAKRSRKTTAKKKKGGRRGSRIIGNVGLKGLLTGGLTLLAADRLVPNIGGVYNSPLKEVAAGAVAKMAGVGGATLITSGAMKAAAITISRILQGGLGAIGGGQQANVGVYDY